LLQVGRVEEAGADIRRALELDPKNSMAYALQSIIAVVHNEKEKALTLAEKGVTADPEAAVAQIALSYAQQANFNLEGALSSLKKAVKLEPDNSLAWARLAEIWQSFGRLDESLQAAEKAIALNPDLSRTQTVLGFAYLTHVKTEASRTAFEKAIELDQADPLPRLGLGLAKIREGDVEAGRREIEIAISLDPDNSIMRSYLGKSYFEEKRPELDGPQYDLAKELDPKDPTPLFYDAIRKQTMNRPVEALHDMEQAIELNDNRAVYRSKLLLDQDLAARSAGLARIYGDLGFDELALVEGWKSVNTDPANYSSHRFLADSYSVRPRHEIARVSELLQSQLLQPLNITPIQPRLAESNLFLISAGGPAGLSFNEFNPLFNRDRLALQASGFVGENDTFGEEVVVSGIYKKASFSIGQTHFETDGWRDNADQDDDIINAFVQFQVSPKTSVQTEYRYRDTERGDLELRFFPDDALPDRRQEEKTDLIRLGFHHAFSPNSDIIGNFMYQDADIDFSDTKGIGGPLSPQRLQLEIGLDEEAYGGEIQHLLRLKYINVTTGIGYFDTDTEEIQRTTMIDTSVTPPLVMDPSTRVAESDGEHLNAYVYTYIDWLRNVTVTLGASADFFEDGDLDEDQVNPKVGITWTPLPSTTVRGAVFRTLKRTLITNQTLEPTQVAGFNQFFDDADGTEAWRYGVALDQKFSKNLYGGVEYSMRDLDVPFTRIATPSAPPAGPPGAPPPPAGPPGAPPPPAGPPGAPPPPAGPPGAPPPPAGPPGAPPPPAGPPASEFDQTDWDEDLIRAYLYWAPHNWIALSAEYEYEKFERGKSFFAGVKDVKTHRVPLGIRFFHSSGLNAMMQATYYDQEGVFERQTVDGVLEAGDDQFWLFDAAISYRLPKRYGFVTIGARNLFDKEFKYFDTDPNNPAIIPDRMFFVRITLSI
jgi:Tfp pilus assembly protein PilF